MAKKTSKMTESMEPSKMNRTGVAASPMDGKSMAEGARRSSPTQEGDSASFSKWRIKDYKEDGSLGSVPPPASLKGIVKTVAEVIEGNKPTAFIDKLAERLAFERTGTRLYETLLAKLDAKGSFEGGPSRKDLEKFHREEAQHFVLLKECIESLGADPTAMTPSADLAAVESAGILQAVSDPRTDLGESLHAMLAAELVDNDAWELLVKLADQAGHEDMAKRFREASREEMAHLGSVREWVEAHETRALAREL